MYKTFDSPLAENAKFSGIEQRKAPPIEPMEENWLCAAAYSAMDTVRSHPLETGGTALLALAALRLKTPILEELAASAAGLGKTAGKSGSGVPLIRASKGIANEGAAAAEPTAAEGSTFVSPWARVTANDAGAVVSKDAGAVLKDAGATVEQLPASPFVSRLDYSRVAPKVLHPDTTAIPSFSVEAFKPGNHFTNETFRIVPKLSTEAQLYNASKDSTVRVLANNGAGSGFFIDNGLVATSEHVLDGVTKGIKVQMANGELVSAKVLARDSVADWALLGTESSSAFRPLPLQFASAREVKTGRNAFLIGRPHGSDVEAMSKGLIADLWQKARIVTVDHTVEAVKGLSGAPLLLENGKVVGILRALPMSGRIMGEATHISHLRPARDYLRKVESPTLIDWRSHGEIVTNSQGLPKINMRGHRFEA